MTHINLATVSDAVRPGAAVSRHAAAPRTIANSVGLAADPDGPVMRVADSPSVTGLAAGPQCTGSAAASSADVDPVPATPADRATPTELAAAIRTARSFGVHLGDVTRTDVSMLYTDCSGAYIRWLAVPEHMARVLDEAGCFAEPEPPRVGDRTLAALTLADARLEVIGEAVAHLLADSSHSETTLAALRMIANVAAGRVRP